MKFKTIFAKISDSLKNVIILLSTILVPLALLLGSVYLLLMRKLNSTGFSVCFITSLIFFTVLLFYGRIIEFGFKSFSIKLRDIDKAREEIYARQNELNKLTTDLASIANAIVTNSIHTNIIEHDTVITLEDIYTQENTRLQLRDNILGLYAKTETNESIIADFVNRANRTSSNLLVRKITDSINSDTGEILRNRYSNGDIDENRCAELNKLYSMDKIRELIVKAPVTSEIIIPFLEKENLATPEIHHILEDFSTFIKEHGIVEWIK